MMKKWLQNTLLGAFAPWIVFSLLYNHSSPTRIVMASLTALALTIFWNLKELKKGFVLPWGSTLFFALFATNGIFGFWLYAEAHAYSLINSALAIIAFISLLIGKPFTLQYAREQVPHTQWNHPIFIKINWILSAIWTILLIAMAIPGYLLTPAQIQASWFWQFGFSILCILIGLRCNRILPGWLSKILK
jgi:hypothetical protein